ALQPNETMYFDGSVLTWRHNDGTEHSWGAASGITGKFGAIPEGTYWTSYSERVVHEGDAGLVAWGGLSFKLHRTLWTFLTNTFEGRVGGFHLHAGTNPGTAGCIELCDYAKEQTQIKGLDQMLRDYGRRLELRVS